MNVLHLTLPFRLYREWRGAHFLRSVARGARSTPPTSAA